MRIFARDGIDGASVADIAEAAGVAKGSVYLYFDSKEALAGDLVRYLFTIEDNAEHRLSQDPDPIGRIFAFCQEFEDRVLALGEDSPVVLHMFGHVGKSKNDLLGRGIRQIVAESRFKVRVLLDNAAGKGLLGAQADTLTGAAAVLASAYGTIHQGLTMAAMNPAGGLKVRESVAIVLKGLGAKV
ncbi:MAG: helix-turn-helix transcriptional regulator [Planctomycetes bacterium]|nr:helix-turn-helix transcriptional regulator [Planctomycetota bacterium]MCW8134181.1 helix-turn-helix transcriptional regulator [Planctomycetota bacterium]